MQSPKLRRGHDIKCITNFINYNVLRHVDQTVQILAKMIVQFGLVGVIARFHAVVVTKSKLGIVLFQIFLDRLRVHSQILLLVQQNLAKVALPTVQTGHHGVTVRLLVAQDTKHVTDIARTM